MQDIMGCMACVSWLPCSVSNLNLAYERYENKKTCPPSPVYDAVLCSGMVVGVVFFLDNKPRKVKFGTEIKR
ncbi:hypothetical protein LX32DRAFT_107173 [Colletotrichum zoysiae]|uniref:Uncharacterized protein n=1 Tax=Colletotrichum zoysiae TaxID=1216348 RepID=A0AAD9HSA0_9PEZI|nr:hypothetical protein LX32DRAFT_107173 [Colletotrichum zoysiae]